MRPHRKPHKRPHGEAPQGGLIGRPHRRLRRKPHRRLRRKPHRSPHRKAPQEAPQGGLIMGRPQKRPQRGPNRKAPKGGLHNFACLHACGPHVPACSSPSRAKKAYTHEVCGVDSIPHAPICQCWRMPQGVGPRCEKTYIFVFAVAPSVSTLKLGDPGGPACGCWPCVQCTFFSLGTGKRAPKLKELHASTCDFGNASSAPCMHAPMCMQVQQMTHSATHESTNAGATQQIGEGPRV